MSSFSTIQGPIIVYDPTHVIVRSLAMILWVAASGTFSSPAPASWRLEFATTGHTTLSGRHLFSNCHIFPSPFYAIY